jgi:hypothetical protein
MNYRFKEDQLRVQELILRAAGERRVPWATEIDARAG